MAYWYTGSAFHQIPQSFDCTAIKPYTDRCDLSDEIPSTSASGQSHHNDISISCPGEAENVDGNPQ